MEYNAVGIDVSKGKSTICIGRPMGEVVAFPFEIKHTKADVDNLIRRINGLDGDTKIVMESTGRYPLPLLTRLSDAGLYVSMVNAKLIKDYNPDNSLRNVKSDKADSKKIMAYTLDKWLLLKQYGAMDKIREQLKIVNRQFDFYMQQRISLQNNLIAILDLTFPGINDCFSSPIMPDGHCKWADFAYTYWHTECVCGKSLNAFTEHYQNWCKKHGYIFKKEKASDLYQFSKELIPVLPKNDTTKQLIRQTIDVFMSMSAAVESLRKQLDQIASQLPEYPVVMAMNGVGPTLGPQLMAEIGDVERFTKRSAITAFAGVDPGVDQSGTRNKKSVHASKHGSPELRKTLFQIMQILIQLAPDDDPVYDFMIKKRSEGKQYFVYMTAGANKFLRIYYGKVKEYLAKQKL
jgi:transposase